MAERLGTRLSPETMRVRIPSASPVCAVVAQMAERLSRKQQAGGSIPPHSSIRVRLMRLVARAARIRAAVGQRPTASLVWRNDASSSLAGSSS